MSLSPFDSPFTYQLLNVQVVNEEYIILEVNHGHGEFVSTRFRNEIHIKSPDFTLKWLAALEDLIEWQISIEQNAEDHIIISEGEYVESTEILYLSVSYYEERNIPLT